MEPLVKAAQLLSQFGDVVYQQLGKKYRVVDADHPYFNRVGTLGQVKTIQEQVGVGQPVLYANLVCNDSDVINIPVDILESVEPTVVIPTHH